MKPNDVRGFVHKRIARGITSFVGSGFNPIAGIGGFVAPSVPSRPKFSRADLVGTRVHVGHGHTRSTSGHQWMSPELVAASGAVPGMALAAPDPCPGTTNVMIGGRCVDPLAAFPGGRPLTSPIQTGGGEAVMGRFGAGLVPQQRTITTAVCLPGMVLGKDDLCYNKRDIPNRDRMWPKGRAPLLTGGEMRAISTAARAAGKLTRTKKRLEKIGLMKKARKPMTIAQAKKVLHHAT